MKALLCFIVGHGETVRRWVASGLWVTVCARCGRPAGAKARTRREPEWMRLAKQDRAYFAARAMRECER